MAKLAVFDQCDKGDQPAQTRWAFPSHEDRLLYLDLCGHHTRELAPALILKGWELHDASGDALKEAKATADAVSV